MLHLALRPITCSTRALLRIVVIVVTLCGGILAQGSAPSNPATTAGSAQGSKPEATVVSARAGGTDDYVAWLGQHAGSSQPRNKKDAERSAPRYRLTGVFFEPHGVENEPAYREIEVLEKGGATTYPWERRTERTLLVGKTGQSRQVKVPDVRRWLQSVQVKIVGEVATLTWSDTWDHTFSLSNEGEEPRASTDTASSQNTLTLPAEIALGDPVTMAYELTVSQKTDAPERQASFKVSEVRPGFEGYPWFANISDLTFAFAEPQQSVTVKLDAKLTPLITDEGVRYSLKMSGDVLAKLNDDGKKWLASLEAADNREHNPLFSQTRQRPYLQMAVRGDIEGAGATSLRLRWTLDRTTCDALSLSDYSGGVGDLATIGSEHRQLAREIGQILARPVPELKPGEAKADYEARRLEFAVQREKDAIAKDAEMRLLERRWFERLPENYGALPGATVAGLRNNLSEHCACLAQVTTDTLGEMRGTGFGFTETSDYMRARRRYDQHLKDLQHALSIWANVNKLEVLRLEMVKDQYRRARAEADPQFKQPTLDSLGVELKNVYVDEGWIYTLREQALTQDSLDAQDSYGQGLRAARTAKEKLPWHDEFIKRSAQRGIYGMQYMMAVFNTMWSGFVDSFAKLINLGDAYGWVDTMAEQTNKRIQDVQTRSRERLAALAALRRLSFAQTRTLGDWLTAGGTAPGDEAKLRSLDENRMFHEATSGGLLRMAAAVDENRDTLMDKEYRIAAHHGRLALAEMRQAVNLKEGREAGGKDPLLKRMLDPLGTWKSACTQLRGNYDTMEDYLAERSGQLDEMEGLRPRLLLMHFDLNYLEKKLPQNYQIHYVLARKNPDYMAFLERHRVLWLQAQQEALQAEAHKEEDAEERERLLQKAAVLQVLAPQDANASMPLILKQQLLDRVAVLDFDGAIAIARELEAVEPEAAKGLSTWLANDLSWEYAKDVGMNTWVSLGNGGLYTAFYTRYFSPAAVRNAPVSLSNVRAVFSSWGGFADFLQFSWGRVNPFSSLMKTELTPAKFLETSAKLAKTGVEQVEQQAIQRGILTGYFGVDEAYSDFLANTLINLQQIQTDDPSSVLRTTSRNLARRLDAYVPDKIDLPGWKKVAAARGMMREYWQAVEAQTALLKAMREMEDATRGKQADPIGLAALAQTISRAKLSLTLLLSPVREDTIRAALDDYDGRVAGKTGAERLKIQSELFQALPMAALAKARKDRQLPPALEAKFDGARREILQSIQTDFLRRNPVLAAFVERIIYTGSGARPDWPEYKRLASDLDFTIVLKEGTTLQNRMKVKSTFDEFFKAQVRFSPEEFDIHCFADERPRLSSRGITIESLLEMVKDPKAAEQLAAELARNNESFLRDLTDPERYLSSGALRFLHYLNKLGGRAKRPEGTELLDDETYQATLYKDVKFESWMGLEMVMDNLKMVGAHADNRLDYSKALAKYGLRVLLARIVQSDRGLKMVNELTVDDVEKNLPTTGGIHGEFVRMAEQLGGRFMPEQLRLFREMNLRKQGRPWGEALEERLGRKMSENDPAINDAIEKHIAEMEGFVKQSLTECVLTNATHMKRLATAIDEATEPAAKEALTLKYREIVNSVGAVWNSLDDGGRKTVLSAAPAEAEMFGALEDIRAAVQRRDAEFIKSYRPFRKRGQ